MKIPMLRLAAVAATVAFAALGAQAQEVVGLKIGVVDSERLLRETNAAKASLTKLRAEFDKREKELADLQAKLHADTQQLDKDQSALSDEERARRQRDISDRTAELQRRQRAYQEDMDQRRSEETAAVFDRANKALKQIFDAGHYDLILQRETSFVSPRADITQSVIDLMNAQK